MRQLKITKILGFLWYFTNPATNKNRMLLPKSAEITNKMRLNLNNPAVMVTSLNGSGVNAPSKTISKPCVENCSVTLLNFSEGRKGSISFFNKKLTKSPKNHPMIQPITPPITE